MVFRPRLRSDLGRVTGEDGALLALQDPLLDHRVHLGPLSRAVAARLDGERSVEEVVAAVCAEDPARPPAAVEHALRTLLLMNLVEGAGTWVLERAREVRGGTSLPILVPEGTRFGCQGSGDCCRSYSLGPLTDEDAARIGELAPRIPEALPEVGPGPYLEERPAAQGPPRRYLRAIAQRCVFLLGTGRCGLHGAFGEAAKPGFCRLYPYQDQPTILGLKLWDRGECSRYGESSRCGPYLDDELARIVPLLPAARDVSHPLVYLISAGGEPTPCDYGHLLKLQEALTALTLQPRSATATVLALGRLARRFNEALLSVPLAPGEPDRTALAVLGAAPEEGAPEPEAQERGLAALADLLAELCDDLAPTVSLAAMSSGYPFQFRQLRELLAALSALRDAVAAGQPVAAQPEAALGTTLDELWRTSLRAQVFGPRLLIEDHLGPGVLRLLVTYLVATARAQQAAAERGAERVALMDFNAGHRLASRTLTQSSLERIFLRHGARAWDAIEAVPLLVPAQALSGRAPAG